jgi:hypothetical protein
MFIRVFLEPWSHFLTNAERGYMYTEGIDNPGFDYVLF